MLQGKTAIVTAPTSGIAISIRRVFGTLLVASTAVVLAALPVWASEPSKLIETMTTEIIEIVKTKTGADRQAAMRQLVQDNFDLPYMGRSALGTRWNQVSDQQRARFLAAVEASGARAYGETLGRYAGYTGTIGKVTSRPNSVWIVDSRIGGLLGLPGVKPADVPLWYGVIFMVNKLDPLGVVQAQRLGVDTDQAASVDACSIILATLPANAS